MLDEHVELLERSIVEEKLKALAGGQLAALVLGLDAFDTPAKASLGAAAFEFGDDFFHGKKPKRDVLAVMPHPWRSSRKE